MMMSSLHKLEERMTSLHRLEERMTSLHTLEERMRKSLYLSNIHEITK